jgi:hypothetical protein
MEITSSVVSAYWDADSTDLMTNRANVARKNIAYHNSATIKTYKSKNGQIKNNWNNWKVSSRLALRVKVRVCIE